METAEPVDQRVRGHLSPGRRPGTCVVGAPTYPTDPAVPALKGDGRRDTSPQTSHGSPPGEEDHRDGGHSDGDERHGFDAARPATAHRATRSATHTSTAPDVATAQGPDIGMLGSGSSDTQLPLALTPPAPAPAVGTTPTPDAAAGLGEAAAERTSGGLPAEAPG